MTVDVSQLSDSLAELAAQAGASVVTVNGRRRRPASGVVWAAGGLIVTANHVVERDSDLNVVLPSGDQVSADLVGRDPSLDLALIRVEQTKLVAAQWTRADTLRVGQLAIAVARPDGGLQAAWGIIAAAGGAWRHPAGGRFDAYIHADLTMYPGFSGGALVTPQGFAGVASSALARGRSLVISASNVERSVEALLAHGHIPRAFLGVGVQPVQVSAEAGKHRDAENALMVMSVEPGSPAALGGILQGDILLSLDGVELGSIEGLQLLLAEHTAPAKVEVALLRGGEQRTITVELAMR